MVRVRLVDSPVSSESDDMVKMIEVPDRMFADGEEPVGVRVLAYHRSSGIRSILRVLSDEEIQFIKNSTFGKFIDLADKPAFSGRFARYILSRQLKVNKKHQVWFRFAGNPIRFSLREFAIVTGLPCGKFPRKSRKNKKERMAETPYWPTLFGGTDVVTVSSVIRMLRKKTVVDKEIRIKYALLALVSSVLMPTNLKSKIPKYIKERDEVALCQNTFVLKESDREDGDLHEKRNKRLTLCPGHARDVDHKCEVPVKCIIEDDSIHPMDNEYEDYSDEETDQKIENVLRLHSEKHDFNNSMFKGGLTMAEVERMGGKRKGKKKDTKTGKKSASPETVSDPKVATLLYDKMKPEISRFRETTKNLDATVKAATEEFASMESRGGTLVESKIKSMIESVMVPMIEQKLFQMKGDIIQSIETMITNQHQDPIINSKSQPSSVQDHYNSDPTSNDTENVMDVLMKRLSLSYANRSLSEESKKSVFLDSKFVASLSRNYSKFSKIRAKETHVFTKGLVEVFGEMVDHCSDHYVFYVPFNLDKKHWVGLCVDASSWIITVFDCNTSLRSEASMSSELKPISEIFLYLMKQAGWRISNSQLVPMVVERAKTVPQNIISADSSLTSVLLMQTHALSGIEACRCIAPHILASEAQRVAVLLYEYHMKL
ncbi:hypothetical protein Bca101_075597 [Brassica carinata]